ncbi:hypothetical protein Poli38472_004866 [Pythium oligandrum]|uniref:M96 mating-specific protein family n=1 Tax=Pythium oligandrum TaxID=41045 RepID=A0A8K1CAV8_PYTOL|nr:hypothetical protein Poli38472_004866 [Pythium oligandrum]|eukprot:TMW59797.1 hypothetical protein Poli38472_004866 [Pythium oligandrum]
MSTETWPADDGEDALTAALAFVDEFHAPATGDADPLDGLWDDDALLTELELVGTLPELSSSDASVGSPSQNSSGKEAIPTAKQGRRRTARRDELVYLRSTVQELETKLSSLTETKTSGYPIQDTWERMAQSQQQQRQDAEVENKKLRVMLQDQLRLAESLEGLLKKRSRVAFTSTAPEGSAKRLRLPSATSSLDNPKINDELAQIVTDMHRELDTLLADPRLQMMSTTPRRFVELRNDDTKGTTVESLESRLLPFDFKDTAEATWNIIINSSGHGHNVNRQMLQEIKMTEHSFFKSLERPGDTPLHTKPFRSKLTCRRFILPDRIVIAGCALNEGTEAPGSPMEGVCTRTRVWHILRPAPPQLTQDPSKPATLRQIVHVVSPEAIPTTDKDGETRHKVGVLTNFVLKGADHHLNSGNQLLENALLEKMSNLGLGGKK